MWLLRITNQLTSLEVLHSSFVFFCGCSRIKGPKVFTLAGLRILLPRVEPILSRFKFSNHLKRDPMLQLLSALHRAAAASRCFACLLFFFLFALTERCFCRLRTGFSGLGAYRPVRSRL